MAQRYKLRDLFGRTADLTSQNKGGFPRAIQVIDQARRPAMPRIFFQSGGGTGTTERRPARTRARSANAASALMAVRATVWGSGSPAFRSMTESFSFFGSGRGAEITV